MIVLTVANAPHPNDPAGQPVTLFTTFPSGRITSLGFVSRNAAFRYARSTYGSNNYCFSAAQVVRDLDDRRVTEEFPPAAGTTVLSAVEKMAETNPGLAVRGPFAVADV